MYSATIGQRRYVFRDLKTLLGKASPLRSGDQLTGVAARAARSGSPRTMRSPICR
jgi:ethanolamine ammonia-lyase large subunit